MAVQFKFRSSVDFDSVDIEGQPSISVRDLRIKIIRQKNLNLCQDSDLVLSDASNGQEYNDEKFQIPSGASVIVRRVPAGSVPSVMARIDSVENFGIRNTNLVDNYVPLNLEVDDFDDFGDDLCPAPDAHEANLSGSDLVIDKKICIGGKKLNIEIPRSFEPPTLGCHKPEASVLSDAISGGPAHSGIEGNTLQTLPIAKVEEHLKSEKEPNANLPTMENADLPSELKCSLCHTFFKDAVMIPCCQHSFCEKCIRLVLVEKARCPKCLATKCSVGDLLPNVSLRQAIEHFLDSQNLISGPDNALHRYAPDGESGIQAKEMSCAMTILQREQDFPHSPSVTGRGSNQIMAESAHVSMLKNNTFVGSTGTRGNHLGGGKSFKTAPLPDKVKQIDAEIHDSTYQVYFKSDEDLAASAEFQGESNPVHEKAESNVKKNKGLCINRAGGVGSVMETGRHRKGDRTCYMCGSPLHFVRDCPVSSSPHPMLQSGAMPGYVSPYWGRTPLPHVRPFANLYGNPGMMPFNVAMVPPTPYVIPAYMQSMYGGLPTYGGFTRMGGAGPALETGAERHLGGSEFLEFQDCEKRRKLSNQTMRRELSFNDDYIREHRYEEAGRPHERKMRLDREKTVSYSDDSFTQRIKRNKQHDNYLSDGAKSVDKRHGKSSHSSIADRNRRPYYHSERSSSEVEDMSASSNWHSEEKHKHHRKSSKRQTERMEQCDIDSNRRYHQTNRERDLKRKRVESDVNRHNQKHQSRSESALEPSFPTDLKKHRKERDSRRHNVDSIKNEMGHDRWQMVSGSDEDGREDYHYHKRKRGH